jgi:IS30 family transposase
MGTVYSHLTLDDRRIVFRLREAKLGVRAIASRLGFYPSRIYRGLRCNWHKDVLDAVQKQLDQAATPLCP